ncbi:hypothetical protein VNO78_01847 [Psophocarpus tetragonolobus]|uniref:Late embryogenesis abundant protein LEA-2 subgroup domain-containing protein n=1 Tax=Psophocarpus tetragonolobus TaxID=3891 RepID=A0AAN9SZF9_PSOTE
METLVITTGDVHFMGLIDFVSTMLLLLFQLSLSQMSKITISSPKHCAAKEGINIKKYKKVYFTLSTFFTSILLLIFLLWLILHPAKPEFSLKQVDIYQLNLSGPNLNSSIQLTLLSKNPNQKVGIYYDEIQVYATYKGQQITGDTPVPPFYQDKEESNLITASVVGNALPVAPSLGYQLGRDQTVGRLVFNLKANGKLRWKVGTWVSGHYRFNVNCLSVIAFGPSTPSPPLSSNQAAHCSTTI